MSSFRNGEREQLRILIVDDVAVNIRVLEALLYHLGYNNISSTTDPTLVVEMHQDSAFDIFFIDVAMPVLDGFSLTRQLRNLPVLHAEQPKIIIVTANSEEEYRAEAIESGADNFIAKPLRLSEIELLVKTFPDSGLGLSQP